MAEEMYEGDLEDTIHQLEEKIAELERDRQDIEALADAASVLCDYGADIISSSIEDILGLNHIISNISCDGDLDTQKKVLQSKCKAIQEYLCGALDKLSEQVDPLFEEKTND